MANRKTKTKDALVRNLGLGAIAAVVLGIILFPTIQDTFFANPSPTSSNSYEIDYNTGTIPADVDATDLSWTLNPEAKTSDILTIWEDPQCPACASFEYYFGATIKKLADEGLVKVKYNPTGFLDQDSDTNPNGFTGHTSYRAINAFACAIDRGIGAEYHEVMYSRSFALLNGLIKGRETFKEGDGFSDEDLVDWAGVAGYDEGKLAEFGKCVYTPEHLTWARQSTLKFHDLQIPGTPYIALNGVEMPTDARKSIKAFEKWIRDAVGK
jgi:hypothetical protein